MTRLFVALAALLYLLFLAPALGYAACVTTTYFLPDGRMVICSTCCFGSHCTVTCF